MTYDNGVRVMFIAHLRREHGFTWRKLRKMFPGLSNYFWLLVKNEAGEE